MVFNPYGHLLATALYFKYLVRILLTSDDNCKEVVQNLRKAWKKWAWLSQVTGRKAD